jgi:glycosyltransferase involved in cell wall biosynthesis
VKVVREKYSWSTSDLSYVLQMKSHRCSVVIPSRNRALLLERCLISLSKQAIMSDDLEVIVVNDGSTDGTKERANAIAPSLPFSVRILSGNGKGPAAARNIGWQASSSPIILFTDDDCMLSTKWAANLTTFLEENSSYSGVGGEIKRLTNSLAARFTDDIGCLNHPGDPTDLFYLVSANAAYRRRALEAVGGFNELFPCAGGEDPDLSFRIRARGEKLAKVSDSIVLHEHPSSLRGVYRMHFRYGRGEYGLHSAGFDGYQSRGSTSMLRRELKEAFKAYLHRSDLSWPKRLQFAVFNLVRVFALYSGYRWQYRQSSM